VDQLEFACLKYYKDCSNTNLTPNYVYFALRQFLILFQNHKSYPIYPLMPLIQISRHWDYNIQSYGV